MGFLDWWHDNMPGGKAWDTPGQLKPKEGSTGLPGYQGMQEQLDFYMNQGPDSEWSKANAANGGMNPWQTAQNVGPGGYEQDFRQYVTGLQDMAAGRGESLAEGQFKSASHQAQQQIAAQAASGRGNPMANQRMAMQNQARVGQGLAAGSATARLQEQMAAQQQLGGAIAGADASVFARQQANAQLGQQASQANQAAWMQMLMAKHGLSAEQAQNMLGYYQAMAGQNAAAMGQPSKGDKMVGVASAVLPALLGGSGGK